MVYRVLADIIVIVHLLWVLFLITGAYWGRKHRAVMIVHGSGMLFAVVIQLFGWYCPLTHLEAWLMVKQGAPSYPGSFIGHYAYRLVYIDVPPSLITFLTILLAIATAWAYWKALMAQQDSRRSRQA